MNGFETEQDAATLPPVRELSSTQRRVLGVLVEKAMTVPESYPMTLKGLVTGCNQKNNRDPVTNYTEDAVMQALDELRELGLVAVIHTESGRTERYRHYVRKRFPFTEPQVAIMTELLLRGRQQVGELRSRASRMVPIESINDLRTELEGLQAQGFVRANGPLERRGVEVDHTFYRAGEQVGLTPLAESASPAGTTTGTASMPAPPHSSSSPSPPWQAELADLRAEVAELRQMLEEVQASVSDLRHTWGA